MAMCSSRARPARRIRRREGFLLIEAVIALAILGLAVLAALSATTSQVRTADKANVLLVAESLAQDRMAGVQMLGYEDLAALPDSLRAGTFPFPFDDYAWQAEALPVDGEYDLFQVNLLVTGRGEVLPLETLVHRPRPALIVAGDS